MKRTPLKRRAPLKRGSSQLSTRKPLKRSGRLRPRSKKTAAVYVKRRKLVARRLDGKRCEFPLGCTERATEVHERLTRARGGDILDESNLADLCHTHHAWVDEHQVEAHAMGLLTHSWEDVA